MLQVVEEMKEEIQHWYWEIDVPTNLYSLFALTIGDSEEYAEEWQGTTFIYYTHAYMMHEDNTWYIKSTKTLPAMMRVVHQGFCYNAYHNINTDFKWCSELPVNGYSQLEDMIQKLCHVDSGFNPTLEPIDERLGTDRLWYPDDIKDIFGWPDDRFQAFVRYLEKGGENNGEKS